MVTLGDVWAITAIIVGVAACAWALLLCCALLFPTRSRLAREAIELKPLKTVIVGFIWSAVVGTIGVVLLSLPQPAVKLAGWVLVLALMAVSFGGTAGLVQLAGERLQQIDEKISAYAALSRGAVFVVLPSILPILGWFLFAPAIFCLGVGAGIRALRYREPAAVAPPVVA